MWAGTSALRSIDQSLQTIRNEVVRLDSQLNQLSSNMASNQRYRARLINDIASVRLLEIESGELNANFTAADSQVVELLSQRDIALKQLNNEIDAINVQLQNSENEREALLQTVNAKSQEIVVVEGQVQERLKIDQDYLAQFDRAKQAESVASEAERKRSAAQESLSEKAAPYQADDLFMYLWGRHYGTTEYSGGLFARFMDAWVARVIRYEPSRVNFWNLTEIPKRLSEHADRVAEFSDEQHMQLQQLELGALEIAGVKALESELEALRSNLDAHDDELEDNEMRLNQKIGDRTRFASGGDDYMQQSLTRLTQALNHQSLQSVHRYVRETVSPTDDMLVLELQSLEDKLEDVDDDLKDIRTVHNSQLSKLKDLESVRRDFKNSRFDDVRSGFGNQALIAGVLGQFIQGAVSGGDVWRVIKRNQRYRKVASSPTFGSGGLGEIADIFAEELMRQGRSQGRRRSSSWHWPKPRGGGGGFKMPRGGGRSKGGGGGFTTGGGF